MVSSPGPNNITGDPMEEELDSGSSSSRSNVRASKVWKYFEVIEPKLYVCRICKEKNPQYNTPLKRNAHSSTTNFWRHLEVFHIDVFKKLRGKSSRVKQRSIVEYTPLSSSKKSSLISLSLEKAKDMLGKFIYKVDEPWLVAEDPDFRKIVKCCVHPDFKMPSRKNIQTHALAMFEVEKTKLNVMLARVRQVSLTVDAWTAKNMVPYVGIVAHWIDDKWVPRERVLSLVRLEGDLGDHLSKVLLEALKGFSLETKVCAITTDNASNNEDMVDALTKTLGEVNPSYHQSLQVPCLAHVINQATKEGLEHLGILTPLEGDKVVELGDIIFRVRRLVEVVYSMPQHLELYMQYCHELKMPMTNMPLLDTPSCWNSTYDMLVTAHEKRRVLERMVQKPFCLEEDEWKLVWDLTTLFEPFRDVTQVLSQSKRVTASRTLLLVQALLALMKEQDQCLQEGRLFPKGVILNEAQRSSIKACCKAMIDKFEKYEKRLQGSNAFVLATVLDPQVKANHIPLRDHERMKSCIRQMMTEVDIKDSPARPKPSIDLDGSNEHSASRKGSGLQLVSLMERMIESSSTSMAANHDEMEMYLQQSTAKEDALIWWRQEGCHAFPKVSAVARDFLAAYTVNATSERFFLSGKEDVVYEKCNMNARSASVLMTLKCWLRQAEADSREANEYDDGDDDDDEGRREPGRNLEEGEEDAKGWF